MIKQVKLKDVATHSKGKQINGDDLIENGTYDYLNGGINPSGKWNEYNTESDTVTISEGGNSSGYVNFMMNPFWCGAHCYYLYNLKIQPKYLYYALKSQEKRLMSLRTGAAMPNIKKSALSEFTFQIDDNSINRNQIVTILDIVSNIILNKNQQLSEYDQLIKSRFVEMFGSVKNRVPLVELCKFINGDRGKNYPSGSDIVECGVPFINAGHLEHNKISFEKMNYLTEDKFNMLSSGKVQKNDILYCLRGSLGKKAIVEINKGAIASSLLILRSNIEKILPTFLLHSLDQPYIIEQMNKANNGSSQPNLSAQSVKDYVIILPSIEQQIEFDTFLNQVDKLKFEVKKLNINMVTLNLYIIYRGKEVVL